MASRHFVVTLRTNTLTNAMRQRLIYIYNKLFASGSRPFAWGTKLLAPVRDSGCFILMMMVAYLTASLIVEYPNEHQVREFTQLLLGLYLYAAALLLLPERWRPWLRGTGAVVMYVLCGVEVFLSLRFHMRISPSMLMLMGDTTAGESREFLTVILQAQETYIALATFVGIGLVHIAVARWLKMGCNWLTTAFATLFVVGAVAGVPRWVERMESIVPYLLLDSSREAERCSESNFYSAPLRLVWSQKFYSLMIREADDMARHTKEAVVDSCTFRCPKIVLIIGESYSKHHSQLYGYAMPTTPKQRRWMEEGRLVAFDDVVSPWNLTSNVFKDIMSTHSTDEEGNWTDGVLFPALFKLAGYKVDFLSNQFYADKQQSNCDVNGSFFLNRSDMNAMCFDHRSTQHFQTDGIFLRKELKPLKHADRELVIVHLYGQHMTYKDRAPYKDEQKPFHPADYKRKDLGKSDLQTLVDYDNACHYNDTIVSAVYEQFKGEDAIFVYLSDHGEYVYDSTEVRFGRTHNTSITPEMAHYEFEVPMVVFFTDEFRRRHPDVVFQVAEARHRPFSIDDLPHLLMGLAGISSPHYSAKHDILNKSYNAQRPRLLRGTTDYDELMKQ